MKKLAFLCVPILLLGCGEKRICNHNGSDIPCGYYDLYTQLMEVEAQINATFDDNAYFPFEEEYAMREKWTTLYTSKKDSITEAFNLVGEAQRLDMLAEMRLQEMDYFKKKKVDREELLKFLPNLAIKAEVVDTSFWGGDPSPTLLWTVTNNSDKTFSTFYVEEKIEIDGKIVKSSGTNYFFVSEQIIPAPKEGEEAYVKPGTSVVISFDLPAQGELKPEITSIGFVDEE
jgi:hypothetical protein